MTLLDMATSCDFLKCPAQKLSNGIVFVNGTQKLASLDFRELCIIWLTTDQIIMKIEKMINQFKFHGRLESRWWGFFVNILAYFTNKHFGFTVHFDSAQRVSRFFHDFFQWWFSQGNLIIFDKSVIFCIWIFCSTQFDQRGSYTKLLRQS